MQDLYKGNQRILLVCVEYVRIMSYPGFHVDTLVYNAHFSVVFVVLLSGENTTNFRCAFDELSSEQYIEPTSLRLPSKQS